MMNDKQPLPVKYACSHRSCQPVTILLHGLAENRSSLMHHSESRHIDLFVRAGIF